MNKMLCVWGSRVAALGDAIRCANRMSGERATGIAIVIGRSGIGLSSPLSYRLVK